MAIPGLYRKLTITWIRPHAIPRFPRVNTTVSPLTTLLGSGSHQYEGSNHQQTQCTLAESAPTLKRNRYAQYTREFAVLKPPKQLVMFCGPKLYQPDTEKKLTSLAWDQQIIDVLLPKDTIITNPYLWHNDLHENNIFINPQNPGESQLL